MWLNPATVTETAGSTTRTTTTRYDTASRPEWSQVTSSVTGGLARPATFTHYSTTTGVPDYTGVANDAGTDATSVRTTTSTDPGGVPLDTPPTRGHHHHDIQLGREGRVGD